MVVWCSGFDGKGVYVCVGGFFSTRDRSCGVCRLGTSLFGCVCILLKQTL